MGISSGPKTVTQSIYFDALVKELDRWIAPNIVGEKPRFVYESARRALVGMIGYGSALEAFGEIGADCAQGRPGLRGAALQSAAEHEGQLLDALEAAAWERVATVATLASGDRSPEADMVEAYLRRIDDPNVVVSDFRVLAGGRSKSLS